ncbi:MAG: serine/threonine protein kinase [Bacteroidales bacterium]|nr:serine/threonine protein kinase [Bacteroidales bacterium]
MKLPNLTGYKIIKQLGEGGFSVVYDAVDLKSGYRVAIKMLRKKLFKNEIIRKKFFEEANFYLYLNHNNIAKLKDLVLKENSFYLIMDFIDGLCLNEYIDLVTGPISEQKTKNFVLQLLNAIEYIHLNDVLHLDIKPANIKITPNNQLIILDFGISQTKKKAEDQRNITGGSPIYMSPEQIMGDVVDKRSDIYSIGLTLYQMVTGKFPYPSNITKDELSELIRIKYPDDPKKFYPYISDNIEMIIYKAINKDPDKRYQNCTEFKNDINKIIV